MYHYYAINFVISITIFDRYRCAALFIYHYHYHYHYHEYVPVLLLHDA